MGVASRCTQALATVCTLLLTITVADGLSFGDREDATSSLTDIGEMIKRVGRNDGGGGVGVDGEGDSAPAVLSTDDGIAVAVATGLEAGVRESDVGAAAGAAAVGETAAGARAGADSTSGKEKVAFLTVSSSRENRNSFSGGLTKKHHDVVQKSSAVSPIATINRQMYSTQFGYDFVVGHDADGVTVSGGYC
jgi:hypothetical protein